MAKRSTAQRKKTVLEKYIEYGTITAACRAAKISRAVFYLWRHEDPGFSDAVDTAKAEVTDDLEQEAIRRAKDGSDTLLIFLLKGLKPEKYRERIKATHAIGGNLQGFLATIGPPSERV